MRKRAEPRQPADVEECYRVVGLGRMRSRTVGDPRPGAPEVVLLQGMAVSDYLLPGLRAFGAWTRAHLVDLPGLAGSGEPPRELDVAEYGQAVVSWLERLGSSPVVLVGHSSSTQVVAHAAALRPSAVAALVLASPTFDPAVRTWPRALLHWQLNGRREAPGLGASHRPEWRRAGLRRLVHLMRVHLSDHLEETVRHVPMPVLIVRGEQDRLLSRTWARNLSALAPDGRFEEVPGAHTFPWAHPSAWSAPVRRLAHETVKEL